MLVTLKVGEATMENDRSNLIKHLLGQGDSSAGIKSVILARRARQTGQQSRCSNPAFEIVPLCSDGLLAILPVKLKEIPKTATPRRQVVLDSGDAFIGGGWHSFRRKPRQHHR
jgi:hypothetical protein